MQTRGEYLKQCWASAKHHRAVAVVVAIGSAWSAATTWGPGILGFSRVEAFIQILPKVPPLWALIAVLVGIIFILGEGGYRLRSKSHEEHAAMLLCIGERHTADLSVLRDEVAAVRAELAEERSVKHAPEITLGFGKYPKINHKGFIAKSKSSDKNANRVSVGRLETQDWILEMEPIDVLAAEQQIPVKARMIRKATQAALFDVDYGLFFSDLCGDDFELDLLLNLTYQNAFGGKFARQVRFKSNLLFLAGDIMESGIVISHEPITLDG